MASLSHRAQRYAGAHRLSRDLHDGVGHARSAISLQAAAGWRMLAGDLQRTAVALEAIESLAGAAVGELDDVLGMLRDGAPRHPEPGLDQLDELVRTHRELGMQLEGDTEDEGEVGSIVGRTAYRVCAEGLSNAAKHGAPGLVTLRVGRRHGLLVIEVRSSTGSSITKARVGRGLDGLRERVEVLGGELDASRVASGWVLRAGLPLGGGRD